MNPQQLRSVYNYSCLIISLIIIIPINDVMRWNLEWWFFFIFYFVLYYMARFLYVFFSGINISEIQFFDSNHDKQEFIIFYQLGFSEMFSLYGEFDNTIGMTERNLRLLIYSQATRQMLSNTIKYGEPTELNFIYQGSKINVYFF